MNGCRDCGVFEADLELLHDTNGKLVMKIHEVTKERDEARADAHKYSLENQRLREELKTTQTENARLTKRAEGAEKDLRDWDTGRFKEERDRLAAENAHLRAAIAPTAENVAFLVHELERGPAGTSEGFARMLYAAIAARAAIAPTQENVLWLASQIRSDFDEAYRVLAAIAARAGVKP